MRSQVHTVALPAPTPTSTRDDDLAALHVGGHRLFDVVRRALAVAGHLCRPNQIDSLSRSAASPALPTAMTTRPQLGSSPATAVLTSGELAIAKRDAPRRARRFRRRATSMVTNLDSALAVLAPPAWPARASDRASAARESPPARASPASAIGGCAALRGRAGGEQQQVSLVEVSPSTVMQLKVLSAPCDSRPCSAGWRDGRIGEDEGQHRRHVGRDHAGALGRSR